MLYLAFIFIALLIIESLVYLHSKITFKINSCRKTGVRI